MVESSLSQLTCRLLVCLLSSFGVQNWSHIKPFAYILIPRLTHHYRELVILFSVIALKTQVSSLHEVRYYTPSYYCF